MVLGALVLLAACGKEKSGTVETSRFLVTRVEYGVAAQQGLRFQTANAFNTAAQCLQWVELRKKDGTKVSERLEISRQACPTNNTISKESDIAVVLPIKAAGQSGIFNLTDASMEKLFGEITSQAWGNGIKFEMNALCDNEDVVKYTNNCKVVIKDNKIEAITAK